MASIPESVRFNKWQQIILTDKLPPDANPITGMHVSVRKLGTGLKKLVTIWLVTEKWATQVQAFYLYPTSAYDITLDPDIKSRAIYVQGLISEWSAGKGLRIPHQLIYTESLS